MFELHQPDTLIDLVGQDGDSETFTVGADGLWRNKFGQIPAGQVAAPPEPQPQPRPQPPPRGRGRRQHGGGW
jgi:hypothetical protein